MMLPRVKGADVFNGRICETEGIYPWNVIIA